MYHRTAVGSGLHPSLRIIPRSSLRSPSIPISLSRNKKVQHENPPNQYPVSNPPLPLPFFHRANRLPLRNQHYRRIHNDMFRRCLLGVLHLLHIVTILEPRITLRNAAFKCVLVDFVHAWCLTCTTSLNSTGKPRDQSSQSRTTS